MDLIKLIRNASRRLVPSSRTQFPIQQSRQRQAIFFVAIIAAFYSGTPRTTYIHWRKNLEIIRGYLEKVEEFAMEADQRAMSGEFAMPPRNDSKNKGDAK